MGMNLFQIVLCFSLVLMISLAPALTQTAQAVKGNGVPLLETTSKRVCGSILCDTPMSIKEKIDAYLFELNQKLNNESTILQQALPTALVPKSIKTAQSVSGGSGIMKAVPSLTPKSAAIAVAPEPAPGPKTTAPVAIQPSKLAQDASTKSSS